MVRTPPALRALPRRDTLNGAVVAMKWREAHPALAGSPCANCGLALEGPYCLACGQSFETFERSLGHLAKESVEGLFHADGRLMQTLPDLLIRPARLTRDYLEGRRASQTPPFRLFLVVVIIVFFVGGLGALAHPPPAWFKADRPGEAPPAMTAGSDEESQELAAWLNPRVAQAVTHQREFAMAVEARMHTLAVVFLPVFTLLLGLLFIGRRVFLFDHAIFAMHSLSFLGLLFSVVTLVELIVPVRGLLLPMSVTAAPAHLFAHMRGVYRTSIAGTVIRVVLLLVLSLVSVVFLLAATVGLELNGMVGG
jgi:hypothetical protein